VEQGTHKELLEKEGGGVYRDMWYTQNSWSSALAPSPSPSPSLQPASVDLARVNIDEGPLLEGESSDSGTFSRSIPTTSAYAASSHQKG
jgi:hypothetical protein